jgi:hypothetical protein
MKTEQRIVFGGHILWQGVLSDGLIEHATHSNSFNVSTLNAKANDLSCADIYHDHHPIALQRNRLTAKEIETPEAIFSMPDGHQPRHALPVCVGIRMFRQNAADDIFVEFNTKGV